ncbi:MAG: helix-turn-helix domain-containing protein [Planctomycetota bacterium]
MDHVTEAKDSPPSEHPKVAAADAAVTYLSPKQVAAMWGTSHDKVLAFIRTGELQAFNVASRPTGRPRFRITLAAVKAFEERRSGHDPSQTTKINPRRVPRTVSSSHAKKYF